MAYFTENRTRVEQRLIKGIGNEERDTKYTL